MKLESDKRPIIKGKVGGKDAYFLLDTGASLSLIDDNTGKYVVGDPIMATGEGFWGQGKIVVLVNANTISAGDLFTEVMSRFDNVTIMGITPSNCSCQAIRAIEVGRF